MLSLIPVESKDSPDSSKLFFTYPNVTSSVCPGFYANTKLSDDPRKDEIFVAKLDGDDYPCTIIQNIVTCYIDHSMYDGEEFDGISIVSTNSSQTIAQKGEFGLHYVGMYKNTIIQFFYDLFSKFSNSALCTIFIFFFNYNMLKKILQSGTVITKSILPFYAEVFGRFTLYSKEDQFQWYFPYDVEKCDGGVDVTGLHFLIKSSKGDENVALHVC